MFVRSTCSIFIRRNVKLFNTRSITSASPNIVTSDHQDIEIPQTSLPEFMFEKFEKFPNFTAVECVKSGRRYTFGDILRKSKNFSKNLRRKLGLNHGDVVAVLLPNLPEYPLVTLGAMDAGLIVTTLNPIYTQAEILRQLKDSSAKAIITTVGLWDTASAAVTSLQSRPLPIITIKTEPGENLPRAAINFTEFCDTLVDGPESLPRRSDDVAALLYSSGTTGLPKGVQLTHHNLVANICQNDTKDMDIIRDVSEEHQDVVPAVLPMFHVFGFTVNTFISLYKGAKVVTLNRFATDEYVRMLRNHKPNVLLVVPPIILFLAGHDMVKSTDLESIRAIMSGAAPLGLLDEQRLMDKAGKQVIIAQGYGLTETSPGVTCITSDLKSRLDVGGSIGKPVPNTLLKVVAPDDPTGTPLGPHVPGELLVKGPQVMKGYLNRPEETANTFKGDWLRTGDVVYYNEHGVFYVTDRLKELIKVKGFQVAPAELEEVIRDFPGVEDAAVIGVSHPTFGEVPRAYVVPKKDSKINVGDLEGYVKEKVAHYKRLAGGVELVEKIPKNASGKIMRRELKLQYQDKEIKN